MKIEEYKEEFGDIVFPEGFEKTLHNLSIEEQMNCYRTSSYSRHSMTGFGERTLEHGYRKLEEDSDVDAIIVKDGIVVGVMMKDTYGRSVPCFPEKRVCTYYASDNNGAGYKERIDFTWLLCVSANFEK